MTTSVWHFSKITKFAKYVRKLMSLTLRAGSSFFFLVTIPQAVFFCGGGGGRWGYFHPSSYPGNHNFHTWCELETFIRDTPWEKKLIDGVITFVTWPMCILQTKMRFYLIKNLKNDVISQLLLSRGLTWEIFKLIRPPDPKI